MSQKQIETLVYAGNVLDEEGHWVSLQEQVKRERSFLQHLENGEVFFKGVWIRISSLLQSQHQKQDQSTHVPDESQTYTETTDAELPAHTPEETISVSTDRISAYNTNDQPLPETDFPPETAVLKIENTFEQPSDNEAESIGEVDDEIIVFEKKAQVDLSISDLQANNIEESESIDHAIEFQETVSFNIKSIQDEINKRSSSEKKDTDISHDAHD